MRLAEAIGDPVPQGTSEDAEDGCDQQRCDGREQEQEGAQLAMQEAGDIRVVINNLNAVHDKLHDLRASDNGAGRAKYRPLPGLRATLDQELGNDLAAAGRQVAGEVSDEIEEIGVASQAAGGDGNREEQGRKESEKKIKGDGLRKHGAARKYSGKNTECAFREGSGRIHARTV